MLTDVHLRRICSDPPVGLSVPHHHELQQDLPEGGSLWVLVLMYSLNFPQGLNPAKAIAQIKRKMAFGGMTPAPA